MRYLNKRLDELQIVDRTPDDPNKVFFGAYVTLEDEAGDERTYRIVGPDEFDLRADKLSVDSPLARAMLGKRLDDEVMLASPEGSKRFYITEINYG